MQQTFKRKLACQLSGNNDWNRRVLQICRSVKEVEKLINSPKKAHTNRKK